MRAEIIAIGTELLLGETTDTNSTFIGQQLPRYGIDLLWVTAVGDNRARLHEVLDRAWRRSDLTITTGGLGPTEDDVTREVIAEVLGEPLIDDEVEAERLRGYFEQRGRPLLQRNLKQARRIASARFLPNPRGTAPGWWVERTDQGRARVLVCLPGPPPEMQPMWRDHVAPELEQRATSVLAIRTLKTTGLGESQVDEWLSPLLQSANPGIGIYHRADGVHVRIGAKASTSAEAEALIQPAESEARRLLGRHIWGSDGETLAGAVSRMLLEHGLTLATMESATGGAIASALTDADGSSKTFRGGIVSYQTEIKIGFGVSPELIARHGLYSRETAVAMAEVARRRLDADLGIGLSGIAGPEVLEDQPPGTMHIAVTDGERVEYRVTQFPYQGRDATKRRAVLQALSMVREWLMGLNAPTSRS